MRRTPISQYCFVSLRNGVIESVVRTRINVQSPVECVMTSMGLAPSPSWKNLQTRRSSGTSAARNMKTLRIRNCFEFILEILLQIHPRIKARDLVISIEHQRWLLQKFAQAALSSLTPARMI